MKKWLAREASGSTWDDWAGVLEDAGGGSEAIVTSLTDDSLNAHVKLGKKKSRCSEAKSSELEPVIEALTAD